MFGNFLFGCKFQIASREAIQKLPQFASAGFIRHIPGNFFHETFVHLSFPAIVSKRPGELSLGFHVQLPE